ncbi:MAG: SAM-dependent DNA methyltransferase [Gammaproteobacteria bacterium]|nr:SAM-dependent DNA methyltransferase [Gammaproteobacteria bacterium]
MANGASALVRKLWQYCNVLRDDGLSYPDYVEQLTYLLFLKMSDERMDGPVPAEYGWGSFVGLDTEGMYRHYGEALAALGRSDGPLGVIFRNARNKIRDPGKLRLLMTGLIGQTEWSALSQDVKGDAYEGLLEKNARDTKSGAGQYFTPRPLIDAIVECIDPRPGERVCDPACGSGGFLLSVHEHLDGRSGGVPNSRAIRPASVRGVELVEEVARLATMNLLLHGAVAEEEADVPIVCGDSLRRPSENQYEVVVTNPPFGIRGSVTYGNEPREAGGASDLNVTRPDFWVSTANKQLNFLQHVFTLLAPNGRAAVVVPDNVLFEGGAAVTIRRRLLESCDVHTLLRLPPGIFYASGVKANVLFFRRLAGQRTKPGKWLWVYDMRSYKRFSLKTKPIDRSDLEEFVGLYRSGRAIEGNGEVDLNLRWRRFEQASVRHDEGCALDLAWQTETADSEGSSLSRLEALSREIAEDLSRAMEHVDAATRDGSDRGRE